jgi:hypothetical protein
VPKAVLIDYIYGAYKPRHIIRAKGLIDHEEIEVAIALKDKQSVKKGEIIYVVISDYKNCSYYVARMEIEVVGEIVNLSRPAVPPPIIAPPSKPPSLHLPQPKPPKPPEPPPKPKPPRVEEVKAEAPKPAKPIPRPKPPKPPEPPPQPKPPKPPAPPPQPKPPEPPPQPKPPKPPAPPPQPKPPEPPPPAEITAVVEDPYRLAMDLTKKYEGEIPYLEALGEALANPTSPEKVESAVIQRIMKKRKISKK